MQSSQLAEIGHEILATFVAVNQIAADDLDVISLMIATRKILLSGIRSHDGHLMCT